MGALHPGAAGHAERGAGAQHGNVAGIVARAIQGEVAARRQRRQRTPRRQTLDGQALAAERAWLLA